MNKPEVGAGLKKCASKLVCDVCMSLVNKPEVGAGLKKCASKLVCDVCEVW